MPSLQVRLPKLYGWVVLCCFSTQASFQAVSLSVSAEMETAQPDLIVITDDHREVQA